MRADPHLNRRFQRGKNLLAEIQSRTPPELREVPAKQNEVGLRIQRVYIVDRFDRPAHETLIESSLIHMGVRNVCEGKRRLARHPARTRRLIDRGLRDL